MRKVLLFAIILFAVQTSAYKYNLIERPNNSFSLSENIYLYAPIEGDVLPGSGTQADPYRITTLKELQCLAYRVNVKHETFLGKYVRLDNNITIGKTSNWVPIGVDENYPFMGYFDGNNNTITRMKIEVGDGSGAYCYGLFGCCKGFVRNLNITDSDILFSIEYLYTNTQSISAGLLCGKLGMSRSDDAYGAIYGCTVSNGASITGTATNGTTTREDRTWIGGLVGYADDPVSIYRCHTDVTFNLRGAFDVGGIVGHICGYSVAQIQHWEVHQGPLETFVFDCTAKVDMTVTKGYIDYYHAGGICGTNDGSNIEACAATGAVTAGEDGTAAGICGRNMGNIIACVATTVTGGYNVGGIVGKNESTTIGGSTFNGDIHNCAFSGHVDGTNAMYVGGIAARSEGSGLRNCLFLGTMKASTVSTYSNALYQQTGGTGSGNSYQCYYDGNLCQVNSKMGKTSFSDLTTVPLDPNKVELSTEGVYTLKNAYNNNWIRSQISGVSWGLVSGFYPRVVIGSANNTRSGDMTDTAIERAKNAWDDETDLKTPTLFPTYSWLPTVPVGGFTNAHEAYHLDVAFSLADKSGSENTATYSLPNNQTALTIDGTTATPAEPGTVMLTISQGGLSKEILLNIATGKQWGGYFNNAYLGNGTAESPFLIHNANQFAAAMKENYYKCLLEENKDKKYYKLTQDIWFNDDLLGNDGKPKNGKQNWDRSGDNQYNLNWYGHLDGDGHLVHGLYVSNTYGIFNTLVGDASIENIGFVNTYVKAPESSSSHGFGFLCCTADASAVIRNCLFEGQLDGNNNVYITSLAGVCNQLDVNSTTIEDCAVAVNMSNHDNGTAIVDLNNQDNVPAHVQRIMVLKNCPGKGMSNSPITLTDCHFPEGYRRYDDYNYNRNEKVAVGTMTNGEFFKEHDKWLTAVGRFPMLKTFADSDYGKLLSLPIYTSNDNNLLTIKNLLEFEKGAASWSVENTDKVNLIEDLELMEPITPFTETHLIRTLGAAKDITTIGVINAPNFTPGITFQDNNAKTFCDTAFGNHDGTINLSELVGVASSSFTTAFTSSTVANDIVRFPELRYFAAVDDLDKVFQNKTNLQEVTLPVKIRELEDDLFSGCSSMTSFTMPASITSLTTHPFYGSSIQNFEVEKNHPTFDVRDGLLMNKEKNELVSYPSGRAADADHSITLSGKIDKIRTNAIYKHQGVDHLFIDAPDYNSYTELAANGITSSTGELMTIYVKDATNELSEDQRSEAQTGVGKGYLLEQFKGADCWSAYVQANKLKRYFELEVSTNSRDDDKSCYWATMYIGFDTQLPEGLTAYIVDKTKTKDEDETIVLRKISNKVPMLTPVVIQATVAGKYKLYPLEEAKQPEIPMYLNLLDGTGRDGLTVNQSQAIDGGCLTLGRNKEGKVGFYIYKGTKKIPPYRAYLTVNKVQNSRLLEICDDEEITANNKVNRESANDDAWYTLEGLRIASDRQPTTKGVYIHNGKKVLIP